MKPLPKCVKSGKYFAKIGSTGYETLEAALTAATKGNTVTLLDDITVTEQLTISKAITLDLGGYTLSGIYEMGSVAGKARYAFLIEAVVTVKSGKIAALQSAI